ncbi:MAG: hypothetical protein U9N56_02510 [Actinomycetota bacterium]|nr:hypothetical protein [Actinomycetota bacterium]
MATFFSTLFVLTGILLIGAAPLFIVAWRTGQPKVARKYAIAAGVIGAIFGLLALGSQLLVDQCVAAGNTQCLDSGFKGFMLLVGAGYVITAWIRSADLRD